MKINDVVKENRDYITSKEDAFKTSHHSAVAQAKAEHGEPEHHEYNFDAMSGRHGAHNSQLHYPDKQVTVNTQMYRSGPGHNVFVNRSKPGVAEGTEQRVVIVGGPEMYVGKTGVLGTPQAHHAKPGYVLVNLDHGGGSTLLPKEYVKLQDQGVKEDTLNEESGNMIIRRLIAEFNEQMSGSPYYPLDYKDVGMRSWTRGDGSRYKDPGYIFIDRDLKPEDQPKWHKAKAIEKFWQFLSTKGARKIGDVSGEFGSDPHSPAVVLGKLIFVFNGRNIAWGSTSRLKNSSVWRQKQQGVAEGSTTPKVTFAQSTPGSWARIDILVNGVKQFVAAKTIGTGFWSIFDLENENIGSGSNKSEIKSVVLDYLSKQGVAEDLRTENPCWKGYHPVGTKKKDGRTVPNCVPNATESELNEEFDLIESIVESIAEYNGVDADVVWTDLESLTEDELYAFAVTSQLNEDWQKVNKKDKTDGMSRKAVAAYRREHPGSKLKTAVTTKPGKLKQGSKASKRRKSYCSRSRGQMKMHNISCSKTPDKAICKARRRWNC